MFGSKDTEKFHCLVYLATVVLCWGFIIYKIIKGMRPSIPACIVLFAAPVGVFFLTTVIFILPIHLYIEFGGEPSHEENINRYYRKRDKEDEDTSRMRIRERHVRYVITYIIIHLAIWKFFEVLSILDP